MEPQYWDGPQTRDFEVVPPASILTHVGTRRSDGTFNFAETPKWRSSTTDRWVECDISMIEGRHSVDDAWKRVRRMTAPARRRRQDAARYFVADSLHRHNYAPLRTPTTNIPEHVSVYGDVDSMQSDHPHRSDILIAEDLHRPWWANPGRVRLEALEHERTGNDISG